MSTEPQHAPFAAGTPYGATTTDPASRSPFPVPPAPAGYAPPTTPVLGAERNPNVVAVLSIVTFGLYLIYWWYTVNREMRDFARSVQPTHPLAASSPGTSTLAVTLGAFVIVPVFVTAHSTARRVCEAMSLSGLPSHDRPSPPLYMLMFTVGGLLLVPPFLYAPLLQGQLNRAWRQVHAAQAPVASDWLTVATAR